MISKKRFVDGVDRREILEGAAKHDDAGAVQHDLGPFGHQFAPLGRGLRRRANRGAVVDRHIGDDLCRQAGNRRQSRRGRSGRVKSSSLQDPRGQPDLTGALGPQRIVLHGRLPFLFVECLRLYRVVRRFEACILSPLGRARRGEHAHLDQEPAGVSGRERRRRSRRRGLAHRGVGAAGARAFARRSTAFSTPRAMSCCPGSSIRIIISIRRSRARIRRRSTRNCFPGLVALYPIWARLKPSHLGSPRGSRSPN